MVGDDKSRYCSHCHLNVYNLSAMTERQAEKLIIAKEGKLCAMIYRRADGTILTRDCPVGLRAMRKHARNALIRCAAVFVMICGTTYAAATAIASRQRDPRWAPPFPTSYSLSKSTVERWLRTTPPQQTIAFPGGIVLRPNVCHDAATRRN